MGNISAWVYALFVILLFSCTNKADMEAREKHARKTVEKIGQVRGLSCTHDDNDCGPGAQCVVTTENVVVVLSCKNEGCSISSVTGVDR